MWPNGMTGEGDYHPKTLLFALGLKMRMRRALRQRTVFGKVTLIFGGKAKMADQQFLHRNRENQQHEIEEPENNDRDCGTFDNRMPQVTVNCHRKVASRYKNQQCHRQQDNASHQRQECLVIVIDHGEGVGVRGVRNRDQGGMWKQTNLPRPLPL